MGTSEYYEEAEYHKVVVPQKGYYELWLWQGVWFSCWHPKRVYLHTGVSEGCWYSRELDRD